MLLFLVMILAISAVSAADTNDTSDSAVQAVDEAPVDEVASSDVDTVAATDDTTVLSTGGQNFTQLQDKINNPEYGVIVNLQSNYTRVSNEKTIVIDDDLFIDGHGYTIDANNAGGIFEVKEGHAVILDNIVFTNANVEKGGAIFNGGKVVIQNCLFRNNNATYGGAIYNTADGNVEIKYGSTFEENTATKGGAIYSLDAVKIEDSYFNDNTAVNGGAVYVEADTNLNITHTEFNGNTATYRGGAIWSTGTANIKDSSFDNNNITYRAANADNGGAAIFSNGTLDVDNSAFTNNLLGYVVRTGDNNNPQLIDGVVLSSGVAVIKNSYFENNRGTYGAAITSVPIKSLGSTLASLTVENSEFVNNLAYNGAAINVNADGSGHTTYLINNCTFIGNNATGIGSPGTPSSGGAVFLARDTEGTVANSRFYNNTATLGGAISISAAKNSLKATVDNCVFENNTVVGSVDSEAIGGAIRIGGLASSDNMVVSVENSKFTNNVAPDGGAAVYNNGTLELSNNTADAGSDIKSVGTITSPVIAVITADKTTYRIEQVTLTARLTDDMGTVINDTAFKFVFNTPTGLAAIPATLGDDGNYTVKFTPTKDGEYNVTADYVGVINATFTVYRTLTDLAEAIDGKSQVTLDGDYTYNADYDTGLLPTGIVIDHNIIINGNGSVINANGASIHIFTIASGYTVTLANVTITGVNMSAGERKGAVINNGDLTVDNCIFINNQVNRRNGDDVGVAINNHGTSLTVIGSKFINNTSPHNFEATSGKTIENSVGAIHSLASNGVSIKDSYFEGNIGRWGAAITFEQLNQATAAVENCTFYKNIAYQGGAINVNDGCKHVVVTNCTFDSNSYIGPNGDATHGANGGAISVGCGATLELSDSVFVNNKGDGSYISSGAAISFSDNAGGSITNCTFENNVDLNGASDIDVGDVNGAPASVTIKDSRFINSDAKGKAPVYINKGVTGTVDNCTFEGNNKYDIYNSGDITLNKNTLPNGVFSNGTITSQVKVTTYDAVVHYGGKVILTAKITDDVGNLIDCTEFYFQVNATVDKYGPAVYNPNTGKYEFEQEFSLPLGTYEITMKYDKELTYVEKGNLTAVPKKGTYSDLQAQIDALAPGETLELTYDFAYDAGYDADRFPNGVIINKALAIIGNDHFISGADTVRIFRIGTFANADIKGVVFKNGKADKGGALFVAGKLSIDNSTFKDNVATVSGNDIHIMTPSVVVVNGEDSYNYLLSDPDSSLNKYYADNPREDGIDADGNPVHDLTTPIVGHSWESAITTWMDPVTINGTTYTWEDGYSKFPWILINLDDYTGPIVFKYDGETKFVWNVANKQRGVISILEDLKMPDYTLTYQYGTVRDKVFDPSLLTVEYNGTSSGKAVVMLSAPGDAVIIKNSVFDSDEYSIYNLGTLSLENNTVKGGIYNNGTIVSDVNATVLDNKTVNVTTSTYELNATLTDDNGNKIYDPELRFTVNGEKIADKPAYSNGLYTVTSDKFTTDNPSYLIDLAADNEASLATETGVIVNILRGTFTDLQQRIEAANGDLVLPYDFTYDAEIDGDNFVDGIALTKNIVGNGSVIDANGANVNIFVISNGATVKLSNLTITGVNRSENNMYGAVVNHGSLTVENATFKDNNINKVSYANGGAAIFNDGTSLTVIESKFINNTAPWKGSTGAISSWAASGLLIKDSYFEANVARFGGALEIESLNQQSVAVENCTFFNNTGYQGGAFDINDGARYVNVTGCTFDSNSFQGPAGVPTTGANGAAISVGLNVPVTLEISDSIIKNNVGDDSDHSAGVGIRLADYATGIITNCTFENNGKGHSSAINVGTYNGRAGGLTLKDSTFINSIADENIMVFINPNVGASIENCTFENVGANYTIYTMGTLSLSNNTIHAARAIRNVNGTIISEVNATLIGGKEVEAALGETVIANATLTDDNGNVIYDADFNITIDGVELNTTFADGIYTAKYTIETAGDKVVSTNYAATNVIPGKYLVDKANVTEFTVSPGGQGNRIPYGENVTVYVGLYGVNDEGLNETFTVIVNNTEYTVTVVNGTGAFNVSGLEPGDYSALAIFDSNPNYNKAYATGVFSVLRPDRTLSIAVENVEFGETAIVNITINKGDESDIGVVVLNINGTEYTVSVEGNASIEIPGLPVGTHVINATLLADGLDDAVVNDTVNITVADDHEVIVVAIANKTISYGENLTVEIDQIISSGLEKVITGNATIYIYDGDDSTVAPVIAFPCNVGEDGVAVDFKGLSVGNYMIIVDFDSADGYYAGQATAYATVTKAQIPTFIVETTGAGYGSNATINVTIIGVNGEYLNGTAYITINSELVDNNVTIENGKFVKNVTADAGTYTVNVYFVEAKGNYEDASSYDSFEIIKTAPTLDVNDTEVVYGEDIEIPFTITGVNGEGIDGTVLAVISGPEEYGTVVYDKNTGKGTISFINLKTGEQKIFVTFLSNDGNYLNAGKEISLNVTQANITIDSQVTSTDSVFGIVNATLDVTGLVNGDTLEAVVYVFKDAKELYNFSATLGKDEYIIFFGLMTPGVYNYTIAYDGMGDYAAAEFTKGSFTIEKVTPEIELIEDEINITIGGTAEIEYRVSPLVISGNVTLWIDDEEYYNGEFNGTTGSILILANYLNVSKAYNIKVQYIGDDKYNNSNVAELVINVAKIDVADKITIEGSTVTYGENGTITLELPDVYSNASGTVTVELIGVDGIWTVNLTDGYAVVEIPGLAGNATYSLQSLVYSGDDYYEGFTINDERITIEVKQAKSSVVIKPIEQVAYGNNVTIEYTVLNATTIKINVATEDLEPVCYITFDANVSEYSGSIEVPNLAAGKYIVVVENDGNDNYTFSAGSAEFEVIKATLEISAEALDILYGQTTTVTVTVSPNATGTVSIIVNGKKYTADIEGTTATATIEAVDIVLGENNVNVIFDGDGNYTMNYNSTTFMAYDNVVTNDTFFRYFGEDGILLDTVPFDELIFRGSFSNLTDIIVLNRPISISGSGSTLNILNGIGLRIVSEKVLVSGLLIAADGTDFSDDNDGAVVYVKGGDVTLKNVGVLYKVPVNAKAYGIYVTESNGFKLIDSVVSFQGNESNTGYQYGLKVVDSNDVLISGNQIVAQLPARDVDYTLPSGIGQDLVLAVGIQNANNLVFTQNEVKVEVIGETAWTTLDGIMVYGASNLQIANNNITLTDEENIGVGYYQAVDLYNFDGLVENNTIVVNTTTGIPGSGTANALQLSGPFVAVVNNNDLTAISNGPSSGIFTYNWAGRALLTVTDNNIYALGSGEPGQYGATTSGIELQVENAVLYDNVITVESIEDYNETLNVFGISNVQYSDHIEYIQIIDNSVYSDGEYAVLINYARDSLVTGNYLIAHKLYGDEAVHVEGEAVVKDNFPAKLNLTISVEDIKVGEDAIATITANELFNGEVILTWGIEEIPVTLTDGIGSFSLGKLPADVYNVGVYYDGDSYFIKDENTTNFTVSKFASEITIKTSDVVVDQNVGVTIIIPGATGNITLDIDGNIQELALENGVATATIEKIASGEHYITVAYDGDDNLDGNQSTYEFNVSKSSDYLFEAGLLENAVEVYETAYVIVTLPDDASDKIKVYVNGSLTAQADANRTVSIPLNILPSGNYTITVTYADAKYDEKSIELNLTVERASPELYVEVEDITVADVAVIHVYADELFNGTVTVYIGNEAEPLKLTDGYANLTLGKLPAENYTVQVKFAGDDLFTADDDEDEFTVSKLETEFIITFDTPVVDEDLTINISLPGVSDKITLIVDGYNNTVTLEDGKGSLTIPKANMTAGDHYFTAIFKGNDDYEPVEEFETFTIEKQEDYPFDVNLTIDEITVGENLTFNVTLPEDANGIVNVTVDDELVASVNVVNGKATVTIPASEFTSGEYNTIEVTYADDKYGETTVEKDIYVNKLVANLTISAGNITIGENAVLIVTIPGAPESTYVTVELLGEVYDLFLIGGKDSVSVSGLGEGTYTAYVFIEDDPVYDDATAEVTFSVTKVDIPAEDAFNVTTPENATAPEFKVTLPEDATGYLLLDINGTQTFVPLVNGTATARVPEGFAPGNYSATVTYTGDDKYDPITTTQNITVASNVPDNAFTIPDTAKDGEPLTYAINLPSDAKGYLEVDVDGTKHVAALVNGSASITVPGLSAGNHNVTVSYTGDGKYSPVTKSVAMNVPAPVYKITNNNNVAAIYSANANYKVLITKDGKAVGAGESVNIVFNGKTYTVKTDSKGYATLNLNTKVKVKTYTVTAEYKGVKVSNKVTIKHVIKAKNVSVKKSKKVNKIKVKTNKVNGKFLKGKKLTLKIKGKKIKAKINKKGVATFKVKKSVLKKLKVGKKYKYTVTYGKDKVTKKLKVKR